MGFALELVSFFATAPGATPVNMAAVPTDSTFIRNGSNGSDILTLAHWTNAQAAGFTRLFSTTSHDIQRGVQTRNIALQPEIKTPKFPLHWQPQDALIIAQTGSATGGDVETCHLLNFYVDLPGVEANLINVAELYRRGVQSLTTTAAAITPTVSAAYTGLQTIIAEADLLKPDSEYAIVGGVAAANMGCIAIQGVDFGNLRVGFPALSQDSQSTKDFFFDLSFWSQLPTIPVFNSANRYSIYVSGVTNENLGVVPFHLNLVQLSPRAAKTTAKPTAGGNDVTK